MTVFRKWKKIVENERKAMAKWSGREGTLQKWLHLTEFRIQFKENVSSYFIKESFYRPSDQNSMNIQKLTGRHFERQQQNRLLIKIASDFTKELYCEMQFIVLIFISVFFFGQFFKSRLVCVFVLRNLNDEMFV